MELRHMPSPSCHLPTYPNSSKPTHPISVLRCSRGKDGSGTGRWAELSMLARASCWGWNKVSIPKIHHLGHLTTQTQILNLFYQHGARPSRQEIHIKYVHKPARLLKGKVDGANKNLRVEHAFNLGNVRVPQMKPPGKLNVKVLQTLWAINLL